MGKRREPEITMDEVRAELTKLAAEYVPTQRAWTAAEKALVREFYQRVPTAALAKRLGRTVGAVRQHAEKLGATNR